MKASRRKFFGVMGGAAAAGPSLAKSVADPLVTADSIGAESPVRPWGSIANRAMPDKASRIADLLKRISGVRTWNERESERLDKLQSNHNIRRYEIDSLRSVSTRHKAKMIADDSLRRDRERQEYWWQRELRELRGETD